MVGSLRVRPIAIPDGAWLAAIVVAALVFGAFAYRWAAQTLRLRTRIRRLTRAYAGQRDAIPLVEGLGYRVLATQPKLTMTVHVDGAPHVVDLRPDLFLERDGERFVADVKTGRVAPDPLFSATRRQLLEYATAIGADGALLVDVERGEVHELSFPRSEAPPGPLRWIAFGFALGAAAAAIFTMR